MSQGQWLIVGYGNTLRSDDGVGYRLAEQIEAKNWPQVTVLALPQLTPELAPQIAQVERVVFIDAHLVSSPLVAIEPLLPHSPRASFGHVGDPQQLLGWAHWLYGRVPTAWWVKVATQNLELGETFSALTRQAQQEAYTKIAHLVASR